MIAFAISFEPGKEKNLGPVEVDLCRAKAPALKTSMIKEIKVDQTKWVPFWGMKPTTLRFWLKAQHWMVTRVPGC